MFFWSLSKRPILEKFEGVLDYKHSLSFSISSTISLSLNKHSLWFSSTIYLSLNKHSLWFSSTILSLSLNKQFNNNLDISIAPCLSFSSTVYLWTNNFIVILLNNLIYLWTNIYYDSLQQSIFFEETFIMILPQNLSICPLSQWIAGASPMISLTTSCLHLCLSSTVCLSSTMHNFFIGNFLSNLIFEPILQNATLVSHEARLRQKLNV